MPPRTLGRTAAAAKPAAKPAKEPKAPKAPAKPGTLPKEFEAALQATEAEELRAYLRDLAKRQRPIRADFLLFRTAAAGAADRSTYIEAIKLALKQPPKAKARTSYYYSERLTPGAKRLKRFEEIAKDLLRTARNYLTDRSDLPAARAIALAVLEVELTEIEADLVRLERPTAETDALRLLRDLHHALPVGEARERLFAELLPLAQGRASHGLTPGLLATAHHCAAGRPDHLRALLTTLEPLLRVLPKVSSQPVRKPGVFFFARMEDLLLDTHVEQMAALQATVLAELSRPDEALAVLAAYRWRPDLRTRYAEALVQQQRFADATAVLEEGMTSLNLPAHSTHHPWPKLLLRISQQIGGPDYLRQLARQQLHDSRGQNLDAYNQLRASYPPAEWADARQKELEATVPPYAQPQVDLRWAAADGDADRVLALLMQLPILPLLPDFEDLLLPRHAEGLIRRYAELLPEYVATNTNRRELVPALAAMGRMAALPAGKAPMQAVATALRTRFPGRRMLGELLTLNGF